jgi:hypothetical protein
MWIGRYRLLGRLGQGGMGFSVKVGVSSAPGSSGWFEATFDNFSIWMQP